MAGVAVDSLVAPLERPLGVARVIERRWAPFLVAVALAALLAEAARMRVLATVAADALARQLVLQIAGAMTIAAVDGGMNSFEREACFLRVIELGLLPSGSGVTVGAFWTALAVVHVVGRVAGRTLLWRALVAVAEVALDAGHLHVPVAQRILRLVMIEVDVAPRRGVVTGRAILAETPFVRFCLLMAAEAVARRVAIGLARLMAGLASERCMRSLECEIGPPMIELFTVELDDVGV